ncbi:MAG: alpha-L-fucosidase [Clostridiales bacterium]|jgi:alpha-L-fucosidase|nr:alpha-L-fucosidase [Clostridiales bacterium]
MERIISLPEYEAQTAQSRDKRMAWWREARFGLFVHYGVYAALGRAEWAMAFENWPIEEYEKLADHFAPRKGCAEEWAKLAKSAGMKYMVLTTRHHEGFSLWDSQVNPYNSVNYGPHRDIVREFVDACRKYGLGIGFYSSLMDWHHPDAKISATDSEARRRFNEYIDGLNRELLTNYGKIDILWFDVPEPMKSAEGWNSLERNQKMRALQPDIIINNRSRLDEDFGTPEEHITADKRDWESCMTFNGMSWGYVDSEQAAKYSLNAHAILRMLCKVSSSGGNLLLNIGPAVDGSIPAEAIEPLTTVGRWLQANGESVYGKMDRDRLDCSLCNGLCDTTVKGNTVYIWNWIWPKDGALVLGGFTSRLLRAHILGSEDDLQFTQEKYRILLRGLSERSPGIAGVTVMALEFENKPEFVAFAAIPQLNDGKIY